MKQVSRIARQYFTYLARSYPVCCLSDEFYFFPRLKLAVKYPHVLDSFIRGKLKQDIAYVAGLKSALERINLSGYSIQAQADAAMLRQSMAAFLHEFRDKKIWQIDPVFYLKIILFAIEQLQDRFAFLHQNKGPRLRQILRLLDEAKDNLREIPRVYLETAQELTPAIINYFKQRLPENKQNTKVIVALADFQRFLSSVRCQREFINDQALLRAMLRDVFLYPKSPEQLFKIAAREYRLTKKQLQNLARQINRRKNWQQILNEFYPQVNNEAQLLQLYAGQVQRISSFLRKSGLLSIPRSPKIAIRPTPAFMQPFRASASYSAPITPDYRESAVFYISAKGNNSIHQEYLFVSAHETYPGHHLLDTLRRRQRNPIRRQVESCLFYEGWASYAEQLIAESGYVQDPRQRLIGLRRQLWRSVRALLDIGIRINKLSVEDAGGLLRELGYDRKTVRLMLRHYLLTAGYQLCYTIGKFEFNRLRKKFARKLGLKRFHDLILAGGQMPFSFLEKILKEQSCRKNS